MRHTSKLPAIRRNDSKPISSRRRRELRWIFAVIFAASAAMVTPAAARQVPFAAQQVISTLAARPFSVFAADLDGDGDLDALSASHADDKVAWYENTSGAGSFGSQMVISTLGDGARSVFAADLDGDGDLDVLSASYYDDKIAWYENTDGAGSFGSQMVISTLADLPWSVFAGDVDGDGDLDVLSASGIDDKIAWYPNTDGLGTFGSQQIITEDPDGVGTAQGAADRPWSVFAADVDGDGDLDVLSASSLDSKIAWYENTDGAGTFGSQMVISTLANNAVSVFAADVDGDGDLDALSASLNDDEIAWYENTDGAGTFGSQMVISTLANGAYSVFAADVDGDGDMDALSASLYDDKIAWYENTDGAGSFGPQMVISTLPVTAASWVVAADMDGDGDVDVLSASRSDATIALYENETIHRSALFPAQTPINTSAAGARSLVAADVDRDGDLDLVTAATSAVRVSWHRNSDGMGTFAFEQLISTNASGPRSVFAADLDKDGDLDVLSASAGDDEIAWYENTDGLGTFGSQQLISTDAGEAYWVLAGDLDRDGDLDVVSASYADDKLAWYANTDGAGSFGSEQVVSSAIDEIQWAGIADLNGDGDLDLVALSRADNEASWFENGGSGSFGTQQVISTAGDETWVAHLADVDADGDVDLIVASNGDDTIAWFENDGSGSFGTQQVISTAALSARAVFAADVDGDGDVDVLSGGALFGGPPGEAGGLAWFENLDGAGAFGPGQLITSSFQTVYGIVTADLDGDGDLDVASADSGAATFAWYENRGGQFSLATTDVAQGFIANDELHDLLKIDVIHEGRAGDSTVELVSLELRFTDGSSAALTEAEVGALISELRLYLDDGASPSLFEGSDTMVASTTDFSSITSNGDGVLTWVLADDDANLQVAHGAPKTYFLAAQLSGSTGLFYIQHRTESSSTGEDAPNDIPLTLEFAANVQSGAVSTTFSTATCTAPFDLDLHDRTVSGTITCEAGTLLRTGANVVVTGPSGNLTLRAGQSIEMDDGLEVAADGTFTLDIDGSLEP